MSAEWDARILAPMREHYRRAIELPSYGPLSMMPRRAS